MGSNYFPTVCGVNIVLIAYLDIIGEEVQPVKNYDEGVYEIKLIRDIITLKRVLAKGQFSHETMLPYLKKKLWHMFSMADPIPLLKFFLPTVTFPSAIFRRYKKLISG